MLATMLLAHQTYLIKMTFHFSFFVVWMDLISILPFPEHETTSPSCSAKLVLDVARQLTRTSPDLIMSDILLLEILKPAPHE